MNHWYIQQGRRTSQRANQPGCEQARWWTSQRANKPKANQPSTGGEKARGLLIGAEFNDLERQNRGFYEFFGNFGLRHKSISFTRWHHRTIVMRSR